MPLAVGKPILQAQLTKIINDGMKKAYKSTFMGAGDGDDGEDMATTFAMVASREMGKALADAIDTYVKSIGISLIPTTIVVPPLGIPVVGTANTETQQIKVY